MFFWWIYSFRTLIYFISVVDCGVEGTKLRNPSNTFFSLPRNPNWCTGIFPVENTIINLLPPDRQTTLISSLNNIEMLRYALYNLFLDMHRTRDWIL